MPLAVRATVRVATARGATIRGGWRVTTNVTMEMTLRPASSGGEAVTVAAPDDHRGDFDDFVAARSGVLLRTSYLLTRDHQLAEDLLQTALTKAWFAWGRVQGDPEPYVRRIIVNTHSSWWRRKWNGEHATEDLPDAGVSDGADARATGDDLWAALGRLPRRQRTVVVLRYFEDLTEVQTAELMGCSVGAVKSQASKAMAKLRIDPALVDREEAR